MLLFDPQALRLLLGPDSSPLALGLQRLAPLGHGVLRWCERPHAIPRRTRAAIAAGVVAIVGLRLAPGRAVPAARELDTSCLVRPALTAGTTGFEQNAGQAASDVRFLAEVLGARVLVSEGELRLVPGAAGYPPVRLRLEDTDRRSRLRADDLLPEERQYRMSPLDETIVAAASFGRIEYRDLYPGVDLELGLAEGALLLRFRVDRGGSAAPIRVSFDRATAVRDATGVKLGHSGFRIDDDEIHAFQQSGSSRPPVPVTLVLKTDGSIGIDLGTHDVRHAVDVVLTIRASALSRGEARPSTLAMAQ